jgi:hypothetical protein
MPGGAAFAPTPIPARDSPAGLHVEWRGALSERRPSDPARTDAEDAPFSGRSAVTGLAAIVRIPVPGTKGLAIELTPHGRVPKTGSTSTLFIQDAAGKRQLRLDYGFNKQTSTVEWHWNQQRTFNLFGIPNHTPAGTAETVLGVGARYFKYAGRVLVVAGAAADAYSIVVASKPLRRTIQVVSAWTGAWAGCETVGAAGAWAGTAATPGFGTAVGGVVGCTLGAFIGYATAEAASGYLYDWAEDTIFTTIEPENAGSSR